MKLGLVAVCLDLYLGNSNINTFLVGLWTAPSRFGLVAVCLDLYLGNLNINTLLVGALTAPLKLGLVAVCLDVYLGNLNINTLLAGTRDCSFEAWTWSCLPGLVLGQFEYKHTPCWGFGLLL